MSRTAKGTTGSSTKPISPFGLASAAYLYEAMTGYAGSLAKLHSDIGAECELDLKDDSHRRALLKFLNAWGCRNLALDWHWLALEELQSWYGDCHERLDELTDRSLILDTALRTDLTEVFDGLSRRIISKKDRKGAKVQVSFGPTATSKTLFVLRPSLFPAWDGPIRNGLGYCGDGESYVEFLENVHDRMDECRRLSKLAGFDLNELPSILGRPDYTTLAQLVVEYYWITITRRVSLRTPQEISVWLSWCTDSE